MYMCEYADINVFLPRPSFPYVVHTHVHTHTHTHTGVAVACVGATGECVVGAGGAAGDDGEPVADGGDSDCHQARGVY
jgi:hypothetical protein